MEIRLDDLRQPDIRFRALWIDGQVAGTAGVRRLRLRGMRAVWQLCAESEQSVHDLAAVAGKERFDAVLAVRRFSMLVEAS